MPLFGRLSQSRSHTASISWKHGTTNEGSLRKARSNQQRRRQKVMKFLSNQGGISEKVKNVWEEDVSDHSSTSCTALEEDASHSSITTGSTSTISFDSSSSPERVGRRGVHWHASVEEELERRRVWLLTKEPRIDPRIIQSRTRKQIVFELPQEVLKRLQEMDESLSSVSSNCTVFHERDARVSSNFPPSEELQEQPDDEELQEESDDEDIYLEDEEDLSEDEGDMYYDV